MLLSWVDEYKREESEPEPHLRSIWPDLSYHDLRGGRNMNDPQILTLMDSLDGGFKDLNLVNTEFGQASFKSLMKDQHTRTLTFWIFDFVRM